jgi:hypothetical protein
MGARLPAVDMQVTAQGCEQPGLFYRIKLMLLFDNQTCFIGMTGCVLCAPAAARCHWKKAGADMTEDEVASMSTDTTGAVQSAVLLRCLGAAGLVQRGWVWDAAAAVAAAEGSVRICPCCTEAATATAEPHAVCHVA